MFYGKNKFRTNSLGTDNVYVFIMGTHNFLYNGKTNTGTGFVTATG